VLGGTRLTGRPLPRYGYATYRLQVHPPPRAPALGLFFPVSPLGFRLWING